MLGAVHCWDGIPPIGMLCLRAIALGARAEYDTVQYTHMERSVECVAGFQMLLIAI